MMALVTGITPALGRLALGMGVFALGEASLSSQGGDQRNG